MGQFSVVRCLVFLLVLTINFLMCLVLFLHLCVEKVYTRVYTFIMKIDNETKIRFESKIEKMPNGCWIWTGTKDLKGYGAIRFNGKMHKSHRVAYEIYVGEIPKGMLCCHHCDVPSCCNPDHLFIGTNSDNMRDMYKKGRDLHSRGYVASDSTKAGMSARMKGNDHSKGYIFTQEQKEKVSCGLLGNKNALGMNHSEETKALLSSKLKGHKYNLGCKMGEEHRTKTRNRMLGNTICKGRKLSEEHKAKIKNSLAGRQMTLGHKLSDEHKEKIRQRMLGNTVSKGITLSDAHKDKIKKSLAGNKRALGFKHTEETKAKSAAGRAKAKANRLANSITHENKILTI